MSHNTFTYNILWFEKDTISAIQLFFIVKMYTKNPLFTQRLSTMERRRFLLVQGMKLVEADLLRTQKWPFSTEMLRLTSG